MPKTAPTQIVWFKRDLRAVDHEPLARAAAAGPVIPLYVAEPELWRQPDASGRQWAFIAETLGELDRDLTRLGAPLVVRVGDAVDVLDDLTRAHGAAGLWSHEETGNGWTYDRDKRVAAWARRAGLPWTQTPQGGVVRRLKTRDGWAREWDAFMGRDLVAEPALTPVRGVSSKGVPDARALGLSDDPCPDRQPGGRDAGLYCLRTFLDERGEPYRRAMSAPEPGARHCSRLSPYLAFGAVSMRETAQATWTRQRELKRRAAGGANVGAWRGSMVSFSGRLHWRHHFMQKLEDEPRLEFENLHPAYDGMRPATPDRERLNAWATGETGLPFVDACMRCLAATGWMNFRMRAMLMAVASYHLWLPWRASGEVLARLFTDYEPGIHWPQTQMQSGTTGINTVRIYNPVKQGADQDPTGAFTRAWVPELAAVPDKLLQTPWKWGDASSLLGKAYPVPIVEPIAAAREAKERVYAVRRGSAYRKGADAIQEKHGSRKSGMPMTGARSARRGAKAGKTTKRQLSFDV
ncbi:MAG: FAD-binding domain-containing protein [Parvularculaceae bacterium]